MLYQKNSDMMEYLIWESRCFLSPWNILGTVFFFHSNTMYGMFYHNYMQEIIIWQTYETVKWN
jgi:hypothetical protein